MTFAWPRCRAHSSPRSSLEVFLPTPAVGPPGPPLAQAASTGGSIGSRTSMRRTPCHAARGRQLPDQPRERDRRRVRQRRAVCAGHELLRKRRRRSRTRLRAAANQLRRLPAVHPRPGTGRALQLRDHPARVVPWHSALPSAGRARGVRAETAPGLVLGNYARAHGHLNGSGVQVLRLYRMQSHQPLQPDTEADRAQIGRIQAPAAQPRRQGDRMRLRRQRLADAASTSCSPGTYYAVVSVRDATAPATSRSMRESRTITSTSISFTSAKAAPGAGAGRSTSKVSPAGLGPVSVEIERFDPVFGWQFYRAVQAFVERRVGDRPVHAAGGRAVAGKGDLRGLAHREPERGGLLVPACLLKRFAPNPAATTAATSGTGGAARAGC